MSQIDRQRYLSRMTNFPAYRRIEYRLSICVKYSTNLGLIKPDKWCPLVNEEIALIIIGQNYLHLSKEYGEAFVCGTKT